MIAIFPFVGLVDAVLPGAAFVSLLVASPVVGAPLAVVSVSLPVGVPVAAALRVEASPSALVAAPIAGAPVAVICASLPVVPLFVVVPVAAVPASFVVSVLVIDSFYFPHNAISV